MKKTSEQDIMAICESKGLKYVGRYVKNQETYVKCVCTQHLEPYAFERSFRNLKNAKHNCPKCGGSDLTTEDIKYRVEVLLQAPVKIIGEYVNMRTPIKTKCLKCGKEWDANVVSLCQGSFCSKCKKSKPLKPHEVFVKEISEIQPNLVITSTYQGDRKRISYKCTIDGYEGETVAGRLLNKTTQCKCCVKKKQRENQCMSHPEFIKRIGDISPNLEVCSQYSGWNEKVVFKCLAHNNTFEQRAGGALMGKCGCSQCISSKGERQIEQILKQMNVVFYKQYRFTDCKDTNTLPFDFYLPEMNMCIEYNGEQHYKPVQFGGRSIEQAQKDLIGVQRRDEIKKNYCLHNGIELLIIPYTEFDNLFKIIKEKV